MNEQELLTRLQRAEVALDLVGNIFQDAMRLLAKSSSISLAGEHEVVASMAFSVYQRIYGHNDVIEDNKKAIEILKGLLAADTKMPIETLEAVCRTVDRLYVS